MKILWMNIFSLHIQSSMFRNYIEISIQTVWSYHMFLMFFLVSYQVYSNCIHPKDWDCDFKSHWGQFLTKFILFWVKFSDDLTEMLQTDLSWKTQMCLWDDFLAWLWQLGNKMVTYLVTFPIFIFCLNFHLLHIMGIFFITFSHFFGPHM